jgi:hypothetical protein
MPGGVRVIATASVSEEKEDHLVVALRPARALNNYKQKASPRTGTVGEASPDLMAR